MLKIDKCRPNRMVGFSICIHRVSNYFDKNNWQGTNFECTVDFWFIFITYLSHIYWRWTGMTIEYHIVLICISISNNNNKTHHTNIHSMDNKHRSMGQNCMLFFCLLRHDATIELRWHWCDAAVYNEKISLTIMPFTI